MVDDLNLRRDALKGEQVKEFLANPLFAEAFAAVEDAIYTAWITSGAVGGEGVRETLHADMRAILRLKKHFQGAIQSGKLASYNIAQADKGNAS